MTNRAGARHAARIRSRLQEWPQTEPNAASLKPQRPARGVPPLATAGCQILLTSATFFTRRRRYSSARYRRRWICARKCPPVYDQGQLGSCTANAIGGAIEFDQMKEKLPQVFVPSRLFIYYNERVIEGSVNSDSGAMLRDGIKTVAKQGACPEPMWPYQIAKFKTKPSQACYTEATKHTAVSYQRLVQSLQQMKGCRKWLSFCLRLHGL